MISIVVLVFSAAFGVSSIEFPPWFLFGAGTSAFQVEGAWNVSDKSISVLDTLFHGADVACDSYHQWQRDVEIAAELGLDIYRFSISWSRLLPTGYSDVISEDGKRYYSDLVDGLLVKGIQPMVTLYHFDMPQTVQDKGGWTNPFIVDLFAEYSRIVFQLFADRVKLWITINEPIMTCTMAEIQQAKRPVIDDSNLTAHLCLKHVLLAHAKAWRIYDEEFRPAYPGKMTVSNLLVPLSPSSTEDTSLVKLAMDFTISRATDPIFSQEGGYPAASLDVIKNVSSELGYETSWMTQLTDEEIEEIRGTFDYFALNYYTCRNVRRARPFEEVKREFNVSIPELKAVIEIDPRLRDVNYINFVSCPEALRNLLSWLKEKYGDIEIMITENGLPTVGYNLNDQNRISYMRDHLEQVLLSIHEDKVNVTGYITWAMMDNFEWLDDYNVKYGLYEVEFASADRTRTPRLSALYYRDVIQRRSLVVEEN